MPSVMMMIGAYKFSIPTATYQEFNRLNEYRWSKQDYVNAPPGYQYIGQGEEVIALEGVVFPQFNRSLEQLNLMRAEAAKGRPLLLVDGLGFIWGNYIILSISENQNVFFEKGVPRRQQFTLEIRRYGNA